MRSTNYVALFPSDALQADDPPEMWRAVRLGNPMDLPRAKGQVTRMINRGGSHKAAGAVGVSLRGKLTVLAIRRDGSWFERHHELH
jgi:hypothetical protein